MEKMLINMKSLEDVKKIVNAASKLSCDVDLTDGNHVVDAKNLAGVVSLDPAKQITVVVHGDHDDYRSLVMWLKELYIGRVVDIYAGTKEADDVMAMLNGERKSFIMENI